MRHLDLTSASTTNRSRVTNGSALLHGIDGRSASARRYRDLQISFADDLGGAAALTEADKSLVRQAAALTVKSEEMQGAIIRGEPVDDEQLVRLTNAASRALTALRRKAGAKAPAKRTLADIIAGSSAA